MKRFLCLATICVGASLLSACSAAQGLAQTLSRTTNSVGRTVGNLGGALTR